MSGFLNARKAYPNGWRVAGIRVTACGLATPSGTYGTDAGFELRSLLRAQGPGGEERQWGEVEGRPR